MKDLIKARIFGVFSIILVIVFSLYMGNEQRKIKRITDGQSQGIAMLKKIITDKKKGRRKNPFRCSDAKYYFSKLNIDVDCSQIEEEVNGKLK